MTLRHKQPLPTLIALLARLLARTMLMVLPLLCALMGLPSQAAGIATCTGKFPNPVTDICWSCILPISIGAARIANFGDRRATSRSCANPFA